MTVTGGIGVGWQILLLFHSGIDEEQGNEKTSR